MKSRNTFLKGVFILITLLGLCLSSHAVFSAADPVDTLRNVTNRVVQALKENREAFQQNPARVNKIISNLILPYVDFEEMARWVVGRNAWNEASPDTRKEFVEALKTLIVNTYAKSLLTYRDETLEFMPLRQTVSDRDRVQVSSQIRQYGKVTRLDYRLVRSGDSWKVYDIIVEGVSLMQGYRNQFADAVQQGGVAGALAELRNRNGRGNGQMRSNGNGNGNGQNEEYEGYGQNENGNY